MKIFLANDTGIQQHVGCRAVSDAHKQMLKRIGGRIIAIHHVGEGIEIFTGDERASIQKALESNWGRYLKKCDALIVNGEGTIHHGRGHHLLAMLGAAQLLGKKTLLVNCVLEDCHDFQNMFTNLSDLTVREQESARVARQLTGKPRVVADSCLEARFSDVPAEDFKHEIVVGDCHERRPDVEKALREYGQKKRAWKVEDPASARRWRQSVASLKTARLYVTGRHHGIYLSALANIPFVALPSNTHKIESLIDSSGCKLPICTTAEEIDRAVHEIDRYAGEFVKFRAYLLNQKPLSTFQSLKKEQKSSSFKAISNWANTKIKSMTRA